MRTTQLYIAGEEVPGSTHHDLYCALLLHAVVQWIGPSVFDWWDVPLYVVLRLMRECIYDFAYRLPPRYSRARKSMLQLRVQIHIRTTVIYTS